MEPLISLIIPTFNRGHLLGATLESILSQTYRNWECFIVDDGSVDYTPELIDFYCSKDSRIKYLLRPANYPKGANVCRNYGFQQSKGTFVNWFDSDDLLSNNYLQKQLSNILSGNYHGSICDFSVFNSNKKITTAITKNNLSCKNILPDLVCGEINPAMQGILLKRTVVENISFDEKLNWADDLDFLFRILKNKKNRFRFLEENLVFLRRHADSLTGNYHGFQIESIKSELKVRRSFLKYIYNSDEGGLVLSQALKMYFRGFKMLFLSKSWKEINVELIRLSDIFSLKKAYSQWKFILFGMYVLQRLKWKKINLHKHFQKFNSLILER